ncbi:glycosyltransferase family 2 protein [Methylophaga sp. SB9B]|uniref:glycosyltransferase family 2 protein n=1 Tax=Methylophaga sp. SB9B TaxID=2570356 RepID=UPI0010A91726|nr:glycosyltransferase family 2 protein [Methylophaga sp. SB9B]THK43288.1 glycosyltransferase family 2 protein [Methylophaga sp. SB9B]
MTAKVSVIIPCYCCSKTIERAVVSVVNQTIRPYELILVNDASTDNTINVIMRLKSQYGGWIKIVDLQKNVGAATARNKGWSFATQPYIAFLDSDDAWHNRKIEIQYQYMINNPDIAMSGHLFRDMSYNAIDSLNWPVELTSEKKITWSQILVRNPFVTPSVMLKRDIPFRFFEGKRHLDDHLLWIEIIYADLLTIKLNTDLAAVYKPMYGASGLSSNMWLMEKAELFNYKYLYHKKKIKFYQYALLQCFSLAKFFRRLLIVHLFR